MPLVLYDLNYSGLANHGQWSYRMHLDGCLRVLTCMHITCVIVSRSVFQSVVVPLQSPPAYSLDVAAGSSPRLHFMQAVRFFRQPTSSSEAAEMPQ